jgi:hypothetical protein
VTDCYESVAWIRLVKTENPSACASVNCEVCTSAIVLCCLQFWAVCIRYQSNHPIQNPVYSRPYMWQYCVSDKLHVNICITEVHHFLKNNISVRRQIATAWKFSVCWNYPMNHCCLPGSVPSSCVRLLFPCKQLLTLRRILPHILCVVT